MTENISDYKTARRAILTVMLIFLGISIALGILHYFLGSMSAGGIKWFNLDKERNLPTWFSGALFFLFGCTAFIAFHTEKRINAESKELVFRLPWLWLFAGFAGLGMSLDEITILHENLFWREVRRATLESGSALMYATQWQILFAPVILLMFGYFAVFFYNRFANSPASYKAAFTGIACWLLALLPEGLRETFKQMGVTWYSAEVILEECLEMSGAILLSGSIVFYTADIAFDLGEERRKKFLAASKFLSMRALKILVIILTGLAIITVTIYTFARMMAKSGAEKPDLQKRVMDETGESTAGSEKRPSDGIWFDGLTRPMRLTPAQIKDASAYFYARITGNRTEMLKLRETLGYDKAPRIVFISAVPADKPGSPAFIAQGVGNGITGAIDDASAKFKTAPFPVKIDIVDEVFTQEKASLTERQPAEYERSLYGLAFGRENGTAFIPEEIVAHTLIDSENNIIRNNIKKYLSRDLHGENTKQTAWQDENMIIYRFNCRSFFVAEREPVELYRGNRTFSRFSEKELLESAVSAGRYLVENTGNDGKFVYSYRPKTNETADDYNILRHAGTIYSMLELYEVTGDKKLFEKSEAGLAYLLNSAKPLKKNGEEFLCVTEDGEVKLGGNALAVIALAKYTKISGNRKYLAEMQSMARWVRAVQDENGNFSVHKIRFPDGETVPFNSEYYPGEAMLAMLRLHEIDGDETWLASAEKAAEYIINVRDAGIPVQKLAHDHWLLYALNELYDHKPNDMYAGHALKIVRAIIDAQLKDEAYPDWTGGFYIPPRSTPTATRTEGLCAAYKLLKKNGAEKEALEALAAAEAGIAFQLKTQFRPENAMFLDKPIRAIGGFHESLTDYEIRIDFNQHNISSLLMFYGIRNELKNAK